MDDLFFGAPVTQKIKNAYTSLKGAFLKGMKLIKGVSAGGEEFTSKLDKSLCPRDPKSAESKRPKFLHGTLKTIVGL